MSRLLRMILVAGLVLSGLGIFSPREKVFASTPASLFGYTWIETTYLFTSIEDEGTNANMDGDDILSGPIPLGFNFPFFENSYSTVNISSNGVLFLGSDSPGSTATNRPIPSDLSPNNLIAGFWDDLVVGYGVNEGKVFYQQFSSPAPYFIIEFSEVTRLGDNNSPLTFQIVLHDNGNIELLYDQLNGNLDLATIGIEDSEGLDGIQLLYNGSGDLADLEAGTCILFSYPPDLPRFKMSPLFQSDFLISGSKGFPVTIKNTSLHQDTFNLDWQPIQTYEANSWTFAFLDENHISLSDSDSDGYLDSGPLDPGSSFTVLVQVSGSPEPDPVGAFILYDLIVTSKASVAKSTPVSTSVRIQAANPAPFIQVFSTPYDPAYYEAIHPRQPVNYPGLNYIRPAMLEYDYYSSLTITSLGNQNYLSAWENNQYIFSNIQYSHGPMAILGLSRIQNIQDNTPSGGSSTLKVFDRLPAVTAAPGGMSAITFIREIINLDDSRNSNVMLAILDPSGQVSQLIQLTSNEEFGFSTDLGIPFYNHPKITFAGSENFLVTWTEQVAEVEGFHQNVQAVAVNSTGIPFDPICTLTQSTSTTSYYGATVLGMTGSNSTLIGYFSMLNNQEIHLWLDELSFEDICNTTPTDLGIHPGDGLDMVATDSQHAIVAYANNVEDVIAYFSVDVTNLGNPTVQWMPNPDSRVMGSVSITNAPGELIVFTWENDNSDRLYYALTDSSGQIITPTMIFHKIAANYHGLIAGSPGGSLAPLESPLIFQSFLPVIGR